MTKIRPLAASNLRKFCNALIMQSGMLLGGQLIALASQSI